ncbi:MAG: MBL fold metallo-hydrolase [Oscillospiraceae bacterium]|nr:MBL fold metallo-hydrolase [Oscillospiraceae bacterium]
MTEVKKLVLGALQVNTYIAIASDTKEAVVVDPSDSPKRIIAALEECGATLKAILLTHGHFDHTGAAGELKMFTGAPIYVHSHDAVMLNDMNRSYASMLPQAFHPCEADVLVKEGDVIAFGALRLTVMETPGHSGGSVIYVCDNVIFSGDTLFAGSVGRTDGWSGDAAVQAQSLAKIKALQGDYRVLPGHGGETTLLREKRENPFMIDDLYEL